MKLPNPTDSPILLRGSSNTWTCMLVWDSTLIERRHQPDVLVGGWYIPGPGEDTYALAAYSEHELAEMIDEFDAEWICIADAVQEALK